MSWDPTNLPDLFQAYPPRHMAVTYLPVWLLGLGAGLAQTRPTARNPRRLLELPEYRRRAREGLVLLVLFGWGLVATARTWDFFQGLALSHGLDSRFFYALAVGNLGAGVVTCLAISLGLTLRGIPAWRLGLSGVDHTVSVLLIYGLALDAALFLVVIAAVLQTSTAGLPLPMSLVR